MVKAVVGANWGDEGKGKITDMLAQEADIIVRFQGGANAGHTIVNDYGKFALHTLPSGVFYGHTTSVIGNGVALNIPVFFKEYNEVIERGVPAPKIMISDRAQIVMPYHILFDQYEEERLGGRSFGSTKSGIAPFYSDKYAKIGFQVNELFHDEALREKVQRVVETKNVLLEHLYHKPLLDADEIYAELMKYKEMVAPYVGDLNDRITSEGIRNILLVQEALQEAKISRIAQQIVEDGNRKFIMIAGPSSSGKTSFSHRLAVQLTAHGMKPHPIAVDNYFKNREDTPLDEYGERNYECLEALDVEKFNEDMLALLRGERIELPAFNFVTGHREYRGDFLQLGKDDVLVIEGIHGLNDKLSHALPKENKFKIYISALTQLNVDKHNRIPTTDGRLIRRIVRDARTRGTSAKDTIARWPSVRRGEEANIFPYQEEADVMFNSALVYELACLKLYAEPLLFGIGKDEPEYVEAKRLLKFFDYFIAVPSDDIPVNSLLREFVGGSCFDV